MLMEGMMRDGGGCQGESVRRKALAVQGWGRDPTDCSGTAGTTGVGSGVPGQEGRPARLPRQPGPPHRPPALSGGSRHGGHTLSTRQRGPVSWTPRRPGSFPLPAGLPQPSLPGLPCPRGKPTSLCSWALRARVLFILSPALGHHGRLASSTAQSRAGPWLLTSGLNTPHSCCPFKGRQALVWATHPGRLWVLSWPVDSSGSTVGGSVLGPDSGGRGPPTVTGLDPKGLRRECGGLCSASPGCNPRPVPNPFLMTVIRPHGMNRPAIPMVTFQMHSWASAAPSVITFLARPASSIRISPSRGCRSLPETGAGASPTSGPAPAPPLPQKGRTWVRSSGRAAKLATERPGGEPDQERDPPRPRHKPLPLPVWTVLRVSPGAPPWLPRGDSLQVRPSLHPRGCCPQFPAGRVGTGPIPEESPAGSPRGTSAGCGEYRVTALRGGTTSGLQMCSCQRMTRPGLSG